VFAPNIITRDSEITSRPTLQSFVKTLLTAFRNPLRSLQGAKFYVYFCKKHCKHISVTAITFKSTGLTSLVCPERQLSLNEALQAFQTVPLAQQFLDDVKEALVSVLNSSASSQCAIPHAVKGCRAVCSQETCEGTIHAEAFLMGLAPTYLTGRRCGCKMTPRLREKLGRMGLGLSVLLVGKRCRPTCCLVIRALQAFHHGSRTTLPQMSGGYRYQNFCLSLPDSLPISTNLKLLHTRMAFLSTEPRQIDLPNLINELRLSSRVSSVKQRRWHDSLDLS
jgi:hypothetical protein